MCGICGFAGPPGTAEELPAVRGMVRTLQHRGPDGDGAIAFPADGRAEAVLGHSRLKVLDLSKAAEQPMVSEDGLIALTFNGEIYNFRELRHDLELRGHRFKSSGDTEVVLRAFMEWGDLAPQRLDGMFALAVWYSRPGRLLLARDRTGKKPLFYSQRDDRLAFGSEIKAVLACPWITAEPDWTQLPAYLTHGYVPWPGTFYRGIRQVEPSTTVAFEGGRLGQPVRFWDPVSAAKVRKAPDTEFVQTLLRQSVERRMVADVPVGALLSGGIDSSIVVALMSRMSTQRVRTFTVGFSGAGDYDERRYARIVASRFDTEHHEIVVEADALTLLDRLLWHHDQPFGDSSAIPTFLVCEFAAKHVRVVLTGDGGDEAFAGYERFRAAAMAGRVPMMLQRALRRMVSGSGTSDRYHDARRSAQRFLASPELSPVARYLNWIALFDRDALCELAVETDDRVAAFMREYNAAPGTSTDRILYANFRTYLPDDLSVKVDRMSMAHSLEARSPLLDTALLECLAGVPARSKVSVRETKPLLRAAARDVLPREVLRRRKHGFGVPMGLWMRTTLAPAVEGEVLADDARIGSVLDIRKLRERWTEHQSGVRDAGPQFWALLTLERWLRRGCFSSTS